MAFHGLTDNVTPPHHNINSIEHVDLTTRLPIDRPSLTNQPTSRANAKAIKTASRPTHEANQVEPTGSLCIVAHVKPPNSTDHQTSNTPGRINQPHYFTARAIIKFQSGWKKMRVSITSAQHRQQQTIQHNRGPSNCDNIEMGFHPNWRRPLGGGKKGESLGSVLPMPAGCT